MTYEVSLYYETWCGESPCLTHVYKTKAIAMAIIKRIRSFYRHKGRKRVFQRMVTHNGTRQTDAWAVSQESDEDYYIELNPVN